MSFDLTNIVLKVLPFLVGFFIAYSWALLIVVQTTRERWNSLTTALLLFLLAAGAYFLALATGNSKVWRPPDIVYDALRIALLLAGLIGAPITYRHLRVAIRRRRAHEEPDEHAGLP